MLSSFPPSRSHLSPSLFLHVILSLYLSLSPILSSTLSSHFPSRSRLSLSFTLSSLVSPSSTPLHYIVSFLSLSTPGSCLSSIFSYLFLSFPCSPFSLSHPPPLSTSHSPSSHSQYRLSSLSLLRALVSPLPLIHAILSSLSRSRFFFVLSKVSAFHCLFTSHFLSPSLKSLFHVLLALFLLFLPFTLSFLSSSTLSSLFHSDFSVFFSFSYSRSPFSLSLFFMLYYLSPLHSLLSSFVLSPFSVFFYMSFPL